MGLGPFYVRHLSALRARDRAGRDLRQGLDKLVMQRLPHGKEISTIIVAARKVVHRQIPPHVKAGEN
jgi:hypothetical protein